MQQIEQFRGNTVPQARRILHVRRAEHSHARDDLLSTGEH
jgi:hypothetical protein